MKQELRTGEKKLTCLFPVQSRLKKKRRKNNSEEADLYTGSMVWNTKGKIGKRWDLGNIKGQNFF